MDREREQRRQFSAIRKDAVRESGTAAEHGDVCLADPRKGLLLADDGTLLSRSMTPAGKRAGRFAWTKIAIEREGTLSDARFRPVVVLENSPDIESVKILKGTGEIWRKTDPSLPRYAVRLPHSVARAEHLDREGIYEPWNVKTSSRIIPHDILRRCTTLQRCERLTTAGPKPTSATDAEAVLASVLGISDLGWPDLRLVEPKRKQAPVGRGTILRGAGRFWVVVSDDYLNGLSWRHAICVPVIARTAAHTAAEGFVSLARLPDGLSSMCIDVLSIESTDVINRMRAITNLREVSRETWDEVELSLRRYHGVRP